MAAPLDLERFNWLSSDAIEEVKLRATEPSNSLAGLTSLSRCHKLKKLSLVLSSSQVSDLKPLEQLKELKSLTLTLSGTSKEKNLEVLGRFPKLETLSIAEATTEQRRSLHMIPAKVVELKF